MTANQFIILATRRIAFLKRFPKFARILPRMNQSVSSLFEICKLFVLTMLLNLFRKLLYTFRCCMPLNIAGRCIVYNGIRLLLLIYPLISSFFFLPNVQTLRGFVTLFSRTMGPRRLKLGTHVDSGQMYCVYKKQASAAYSSFYFFIFFLSNFQTLKLDAHVDSGWMYRVYRNMAAAAYLSFFHFSFAPHSSHELWDQEDWN